MDEDQIVIGPRGPERARPEHRLRRLPRRIIVFTVILVVIGLAAGSFIKDSFRQSDRAARAAVVAAHVSDDIDTLQHLQQELGNIRWMIGTYTPASLLPYSTHMTPDEMTGSFWDGGLVNEDTLRCYDLTTWYNQMAARVPQATLRRHRLPPYIIAASYCYGLNPKNVRFVPAIGA